MTQRRRRRIIAAPTAGQDVFVPHVAPELDWIISEEYVVDAKTTLVPGTEFRVEGEGLTRFRFQRHIRRPNGIEWIDCMSDHGFRSFRPARIRKVYRDRKSTDALAAIHKAKVKARRSA